MYFMVRKYKKNGRIIYSTNMTKEEVEQIEDGDKFDYVFIEMEGELRTVFTGVTK